ncbi:Ankyrin Repeat And Kh Domain-Containing Protein 1 [Manis pentadactyla]|nr:Ankyrin Repeat And Kh Domain-Containing Protein 1 [Manis pentadactyla]
MHTVHPAAGKLPRAECGSEGGNQLTVSSNQTMWSRLYDGSTFSQRDPIPTAESGAEWSIFFPLQYLVSNFVDSKINLGYRDGAWEIHEFKHAYERVTDQPHKVADFLCEDENVDTQENKMKSPDMQPDE